MNCVVLTWIGENQDIHRNPPADKLALPVRIAGTYPPGDRIAPASAHHTVRRMLVAAVAVASVAVHRIAVVEKPDAVPATLSAAGYAVRFEAARPSVVAAFEAVANTAQLVAVVAALVFAVAELVPAVVVRNLP